MVLLLDNYDSFTYMLRDYVLQCGQQCLVFRNNETTVSEIAHQDFDSIIISPGPGAPAQAGITLDVIKTFEGKLPILGICLGHQAIGQVYGAKLTQAAKPMHGKTSMVKHNGHALFKDVPQPVQVMRYHSLILEQVEQTSLQVIAETLNGEVMAIVHPEKKIAGLQFHPESVLTQNGLQMLQNWFDFIA